MIPRVLEDVIVLLLCISTSNYRIRSDLTVRTSTCTRTENREQVAMQRRIPEWPTHSDRQGQQRTSKVPYIIVTIRTMVCRKGLEPPTSLSPKTGLARWVPVDANALCPANASTRHTASGAFYTIGTYILLWLKIINKAGWPNGKALDYESRDCRFDPCVGHFFVFVFAGPLWSTSAG